MVFALRTLTANIRKRRGTKVAINVPVFHDTNTPKPFVETFPVSPFPEGPQGALPDHIYMDAMCFGMGCCCLQVWPAPPLSAHGLCTGPPGSGVRRRRWRAGRRYLRRPQVTFQACSIQEARRLYDHLATVTPIMLAITAAAPVFRGYLADYDVRWSTISSSVDDRTPQERGLEVRVR